MSNLKSLFGKERETFFVKYHDGLSYKNIQVLAFDKQEAKDIFCLNFSPYRLVDIKSVDEISTDMSEVLMNHVKQYFDNIKI